MPHTHLHRLPRLLALVPVCVAWNVHAQTATPALPEVLIQSGRLEQKQFDAPASVSSIDRSTIESSGPQVNVSDVLARVPGVVALNRNNYAQDLQISIRGFGARAAFGLRGIRLITDGIPASTPDGQGQASTISLTSTDRIEVLTGPLAQIYGNAAGGVIQTFTREAGPQPEFGMQLYTGSFGLQRTDWQLSGRTGQVGIVADYSTFDIDGYRTNSEAKRQQLNSVITVDASPDTRWKLILNLFRMPLARDPLGLRKSQLNDPAQGGYGAVIDGTRKIVSQDQIGWVMDHRIDRNLQWSARLYTGTRDNLQYQASANAANPTNPNGRWTGLERRFSGLGLQLKGRATAGTVPMDWTVGLDIDRSAEQRKAGTTLNGEINTPNVTRNELNRSQNRDVFAQANWYLSDKWTLTTGVRRSAVTLSSTDHFLTDGNDGSGRVRYSATNPVLGITHHVSDTLNVYANAGRGFETPTLAEAAFVSSGGAAVGQFNPKLQASRSRHLELGSKWTPSPATRLTAALFRIDTDNEIVPNVSTSGSTAFINATQTRRDGLELGWQQLWSPHWRSEVQASALRAVYSRAFSSAAAGSIAAGNRMPSIPARQLFAALKWNQHSASANPSKPPPGFEAELQWQARSRIYANDLNTLYAPGYGLLNARLRHRVQDKAYTLDTYVGIDNLADHRYIGSVIANQSSFQSFEPGLPRNWVVGVSAKIPF